MEGEILGKYFVLTTEDLLGPGPGEGRCLRAARFL